MIFKNKIKEKRRQKGMTQSYLADQVNISRQELIQIEKNERNPKLKNVMKIAKKLETTVEELEEIS